MSLILAIEPDPQQSARLTDLVRRRLSADLVHATTTEGALAALARVGDRVPDLVLVPSLLSAHEDAAIAGALRVIAAAANVRMLTIPLLADPEQPVKSQGMLARLRGKKPRATTGGCDPEVFADQIATYLAEAAAERKAEREESEEIGALGALGAPGAPGASGAPGAIAAEPEPMVELEPMVEPEPIVVPQQTYKPLIIQPVIVAPPEIVIASAEIAAPAMDSWPDRSADAMREIASVDAAPQSEMIDAPFVAAVGESVIVPAEPTHVDLFESQGEAPHDIEVALPVIDTASAETTAIESPAIEMSALEAAIPAASANQPDTPQTVVVVSEAIVAAPESVVAPQPIGVASQPPVLEHEFVVAALLESLAAPAAAVPEPVQAAPVAHPEPLPEPVATIEPLRTPVSEVTPTVAPEPPAEQVKARFWGSRIRIPKVVAKLVEPKRVEAPLETPIEEPAAASASMPEPVAEIGAAPAPVAEPVLEIAAAAAPEPIAEIVAPPVMVEEPAIARVTEPPVIEPTPAPAAASAEEAPEPTQDAPSVAAPVRAAKSRVRIPKQSGARKAKPKPAPREEREEIDIDALIAPLLTEMAARRTPDVARNETSTSYAEAPPAALSASVAPSAPSAPSSPDVDPMFFADDAMIVPPPTPAQAERSAWIELVESLRQDIERLKAEREQPAAPPPPVEEPSPSLVAKTVSSIRRRPAAPVVQMPNPASRVSRTQPRKPVEDQWGLFDPEQCGFAALLAKLDEIGARDEASA